MAAKPWENRLMEQQSNTDCVTTPLPKGNPSVLSEVSSVKVRKNNMTKRISARPPLMAQATHSSSSPSSDFRQDESSASSSMFTTTTPVSGNTASDRTAESNTSRPSYMNMTEATKAKQRNLRAQRQQSMDEFQFMKKSMAFSNGDLKSRAGLDSIARPTYVPTGMDKFTGKVSDREDLY